MFIVYRATNKKNGKVYIGISGRTLAERWNEHLSRARLGVRGSRLYAAIRKYGAAAFELIILERTRSQRKIRELEKHYIKAHDSYANGYNCNLGGHGFLEFPEDIRRKISAAQKGKIIPAEVREKMSRAKQGDSRCALNFGAHTRKGKSNPRSKSYLIRFPDGTEHVVTGIRAFQRQHGLSSHLWDRGHDHGFVFLKRLND